MSTKPEKIGSEEANIIYGEIVGAVNVMSVRRIKLCSNDLCGKYFYARFNAEQATCCKSCAAFVRSQSKDAKQRKPPSENPPIQYGGRIWRYDLRAKSYIAYIRNHSPRRVRLANYVYDKLIGGRDEPKRYYAYFIDGNPLNTTKANLALKDRFKRAIDDE